MRVAFICHDCGLRHGRVRTHLSTFHTGHCDCCGEKTGITEARDYGVYLIDDNFIKPKGADDEETIPG